MNTAAVSKTYSENDTSRSSLGTPQGAATDQNSSKEKQQKRAPLFLDAAIQAQAHRLDGNVYITGSKNQWMLTLFFGVLATMIIMFVVFGSYTRKATVIGSLKPVDGLTKVYADKTGVLTELLVQPGATVSKGDALARIETNQYISEQQDASAMAQRELEKTIKAQQGLMESIEKRFKIEQDSIASQISVKQTMSDSLQRQWDIAKQKSRIQFDNLQRMKTLQEKQLVSDVAVSQAENDYFDSQLRMESLENQLATNLSQIADHRVVLEKLPLQRAQELENLKQEISMSQQQLLDIKRQQTNIVVAPASGRVSTLLVEEGSLARQGRPLMTIIPEWSLMEAEVFVPASAISFVTEGQDVRIKYEALPVQRYGTFPGEVSAISENTINPSEYAGPFQINQPVYKVKVKIFDQNIDIRDQNFPLLPGMVVTMDLMAEELTLIEWLLEPVWDVKERF